MKILELRHSSSAEGRRMSVTPDGFEVVMLCQGEGGGRRDQAPRAFVDVSDVTLNGC
jgi:hypothetical protein